ncbi:hypothetical protein BO99DRAFT_348309, partial [Aspergillus violaceofuscus CBS 115571]
FGKLIKLNFLYNSIFPGIKYSKIYINLFNKYFKLVLYLISKNNTNLNLNNIFILSNTGAISYIINW